MADYRQIHTRIWKDAWFMELDTEDKLFFVYLFSNERASVAGIYELSQKVMAFETGLTKDRIVSALDRFKAARKVLYENGIVWVVNLRKYNENNSPKVVTRLQKDLSEIPDCKLKKLYLGYHDGKIPDLYDIDTVSIPGSENESEHEHDTEHEHEHEQEEGADAPPHKQKPEKAGTHPAVAKFREKAKAFPAKGQYEAIEKAVGLDPARIELWGQTVEAYILMGWSPRNISGMLDFFKRNEIPGANRKKESPNGTHNPRPTTQPTGELSQAQLIARRLSGK